MASSITSEFCFVLDGHGGGKRIKLNRLPSIKKKSVWIHLDEEDEQSVVWLYEQSGLDEIVIENILDEDTQPRYFTTPQGLLVVLRGVNSNRNADVEDMISLRLWIEKDRVISSSHRRLKPLEKMAASLKANTGPVDALNVFIRIAEEINESISSVVSKIDDELDDIEDEMIDVSRGNTTRLQSKVSDIRHKILGIRRYLGPQRDLFHSLAVMNLQTITEEEQITLKEINRDLIKSVEDLDYAREHATVHQEELNSRINVQLNQTMYILTVIMVVLAPLTLITGILGSNIGGIPWNTHPYGFLYVCLVLLAIGILQVWYLKHKKWF